MPLPDLAPLCIQVNAIPGGLCITFPGGATLCAQADLEFGDLSKVSRSLLAQLNTGLAPLTPFFDVLDLLKAIGDCIQAIPDALGPPPDPTGLINCVPGLVEKLNKLLQLLPALTIPSLIKDAIQALVYMLTGIRQQIAAFVAQQARLLAAATAATATGNFDLQIVVDCETGNLDAQLLNLNAGMEPLNRLIGLINTLAKIVHLPCLPTIADVELTDAALEPIDAAIEILQTLAAALPTFALPQIPTVGPDGKCS